MAQGASQPQALGAPRQRLLERGNASAGLGPWSPRVPVPWSCPLLLPDAPSLRSARPCSATTHSLVSRVMMMRMGLLFIPPTQLLLHMKLYRMVVNSVPTCPGGESRG